MVNRDSSEAKYSTAFAISSGVAMRRIGVTVVFYITSTNLNAAVIPEDIEVHYKTFVEE